MVCGVLLLQSFGTEQIGHTGLLTHLFAYACVEVKFIAISFSCIFSCNKAGGGFGDEQCWVLLWIPNEDFGCITYMHRAQLPHISPVRWNRTLFIFLWCAGCSCCSLLELNRLVTLGCRQTYLLVLAQRLNSCQFIFRASLPASKQAEVLGMSSGGWVHGPPMKTLAVLHHMHRARLPHISLLRWNLTLFILLWYAWCSCCNFWSWTDWPH